MADLTKIKWAHAANSLLKLQEALDDENIDMIEADIILGQINGSGPFLPVMGHPPTKSSDITLEDFLLKILSYNGNSLISKGVKLDFKSIEVFEGSINILDQLWEKVDFPIWLNADIIAGPVNQTLAIPVDSRRFLEGSMRFSSAVLSIGWTTLWGPNFKDGSYKDEEIENMITTIKENNVTNRDITFPVRAGITANSLSQLQYLIRETSPQNNCTFTIWSSPNDFVDVKKLKSFIYEFGLNRIYLDVPKELEEQLNL